MTYECSSCTQSLKSGVAISRLVTESSLSDSNSVDTFLESPRLVRKNTIMGRIPSREVLESGKVKVVLDTVQSMLNEDATNKFLIFFQFTSLLEITKEEIERRGLGSCGVSNASCGQQRSLLWDPFLVQEASFNILLISLRAAGEGINLQAANKAFVIDPWWNPAAELQAVQRAHRLGQTRRVDVVKFVVTNTIEERIRTLQRKKQLAADTTVGGDENASYHLQQLSLQDLKFLFKV
ncbi:DNA repair helicase, putative [Perkinsus marinus ATCC 50983]|uniref:DNA repair helicase, putative n=1 Tax=Perkinsus marinus (strain ATCC 50983 / TXsc) TaxID=423536 RepID=C5K4W5_PERM5|nr:DNA repair helicase, putative [Perkinsus marinus ATCC 50983]EER20387.1 DNA repair helicase, putative [Perkinsus marinus ATCC 50983]|eukprot:XP_002788591.1 DNA repair helicase, putative [Perkinsus marinus ATCC 50983]